MMEGAKEGCGPGVIGAWLVDRCGKARREEGRGREGATNGFDESPVRGRDHYKFSTPILKRETNF